MGATAPIGDLQRRLMRWYGRHARALPWRAPPGTRAEPYHVWLSEIMLQQTTITTVGPYYREFLSRWPTLDALAAAPLDEVMTTWAGLGYYARARNLHRCARVVHRDHAGALPNTEQALAKLPGIGPYTAAAIAAIAFGREATPVDGNIERVVARLFGMSEPLPAGKKRIAALAATLTPARRPGDFAQAMMDLGASVCRPKQPLCGSCPWRAKCRARAEGCAEELPRRPPKPARPKRHGVAYWAVKPDGEVLLRRRPPRGLLGAMMEVPSTPWHIRQTTPAPPLSARWQKLPGRVRHIFTHFELELTVVAASVAQDATADGIWVHPQAMGDYAMPTLMRKVADHALTNGISAAGK